VARLLFDEQLAEVLVELVADVFPQSLHVRPLGAAARDDRGIWNLAKENGCVLVTKDEDFHRLSVLLGAPPKVIWIRLGNCSTADIAALLRRHAHVIGEFVDRDDVVLLELGGG
jgi:predicted nuclease of predicted toxin-antitoxin system